MARKTGGLLKVAAMLGLAVAAKQLSKKENRDVVKNEYNKVKEDPKSYAQDVQDKLSKQAGEYQERAKSEYDRVKQDPKGYAQNVQEKVNKQAAEYQERAKSEIEKAKEEFGEDYLPSMALSMEELEDLVQFILSANEEATE